MHVLAFENQPTAFAGGQERSLFEVLSFLALKGANISLCFRQKGEMLEKYGMFLQEAFCVTSRQLQRPFFPFLADLVRLRSKPRARSWDVLYANQYSDTPMVAALGLLLGIPMVCHLRLPCPSYLSRQYRWGLMRCARIITISNYTKNTYVNAGIPAERIGVVYNGIDVDAFTPAYASIEKRASDRPYRVAYFGRLCPVKGIEVLLRAFQLPEIDALPVELHVRGSVQSSFVGPEYLGHLQQIAQPQIDRRVFFRPHCSDIRAELSKTDLVVLPSTWEEPFGRVLIEAMASGVPVVASNVGGIPEVLSPRFADHLVPPGDAQALAAAVSRFVTWRHTDRSLGAESREWVVANFSHSDRWNEVYSILLDAARQSGANRRAGR